MLSASSGKNTSGKAIFIDEIEKGLHYSKLKDIAKAIIEISQKEDIQVYITTHDNEIISAFVKASEELKFEGISAITLIKDENNTIQAMVSEYQNITYGINNGADLR